LDAKSFAVERMNFYCWNSKLFPCVENRGRIDEFFSKKRFLPSTLAKALGLTDIGTDVFAGAHSDDGVERILNNRSSISPAHLESMIVGALCD
jgi:hypothetical protein